MITFNDGRSTASTTEFDHKCGVLPSEKLVMLTVALMVRYLQNHHRWSIGSLDLRDLKRQVSEQALFIEDKAENRLSHSSGVVLIADTLRHQGNVLGQAGGPARALREPVERVARHECDDRAVLSDTKREADRGRPDAVVIDSLTVDPQDALAKLPRDASTALGHSPKDQYARCLVDQLLVLRVERVEARESLIGARVNLRLGAGEGWGAGDKSEEC